ncbi:MAG: Uma2 family endonuclease [Terriglobia bacterium]
MPTVVSPPEQRVVLGNVTWETYERLLDEHLNCSSPRFTYDQGVLEIMSPSAEHEWYNRLISDLVKLLTRELRIDVLDLGSTTFRRAATKRGFEPDSSFYVTHARQVRGKERIDLAVDPPPDIVVEVAVTHPSLSKFPICAELGVPEIWSYDGSLLRIYGLSGSGYIEMPSSGVLPRLDAKELSEFLELGRTMDSVTWPNEVLERFHRSI